MSESMLKGSADPLINESEAKIQAVSPRQYSEQQLAQLTAHYSKIFGECVGTIRSSSIAGNYIPQVCIFAPNEQHEFYVIASCGLGMYDRSLIDANGNVVGISRCEIIFCLDKNWQFSQEAQKLWPLELVFSLAFEQLVSRIPLVSGLCKSKQNMLTPIPEHTPYTHFLCCDANFVVDADDAAEALASLQDLSQVPPEVIEQTKQYLAASGVNLAEIDKEQAEMLLRIGVSNFMQMQQNPDDLASDPSIIKLDDVEVKLLMFVPLYESEAQYTTKLKVNDFVFTIIQQNDLGFVASEGRAPFVFE